MILGGQSHNAAGGWLECDFAVFCRVLVGAWPLFSKDPSVCCLANRTVLPCLFLLTN